MPSNVVVPGDLYIGRGEVYIDRLDANRARTGERFVGNCTVFSISTQDETREKYSSAEATAPLLKSVNVRRTPEILIALDEYNMENLALAFMGTSNATFAQTGASASNVVVPTGRVKQGYWFPLESPSGTPRRGTVAEPLSALTVETSPGAVAKVLGTDYEVDLVSGRVYVKPGGGITDGEALQVDFTYPTLSSTDAPYVIAGVSNFIEAYVRVKTKQAAGPSMEAEIWLASLSPDGEVPFIGDDFGEFRLRGRVLADTTSHPTEPYFRVYRTAAT